MIRPLRRRHLRMIVVLAALVTGLFVLAIRSRPAPPRPTDLPELSASQPNTRDAAEGTDGP